MPQDNEDEILIPPILTKEKYDALQEVEKKLYKASETGEYIIRLEGGYQDASALLKAKQHEKENANKSNAELIKARQALALAEKKAKELENANLNVSEVEKGYIKKISEIEERMNANEARLRAKAEKAEKEAICNDVSSLFTSKKVAIPLISSRVTFEVVDGESKAVYLDDMGNKTDWTKEQFKQNLLDDKELHGSLIGTRSQGSSASNSKTPSSAGVKPSQLDEVSIQKWMADDPDGYIKAIKAEMQSKHK